MKIPMYLLNTLEQALKLVFLPRIKMMLVRDMIKDILRRSTQ